MVPVKLRNQIWGRLHALDVEPHLRSAVSVAVQHAASALTMGLLHDTTLIGVGRSASGSFVHDLIARRLSRRQALEMARSIGADLSATVAAAAVEMHERDDIGTTRGRARMEPICSAIEQGLRSSGVDCVWWADERRGLLCLGARDSAAIRAGVNAAVDRLTESGILEELADVCLGMSEMTTVENLGDALDHAREAASLGSEPEGTVIRWYGQLGLDRLFLRIAEGPELAAFVEAELGRLLAYDAEHRAQLLPVLEAYVNAGGSKSEAARVLFVGRRSLYYKLESISKTLDRDLDNPDDRTALAVALRGLAVLRRRGSRVHSAVRGSS